MKFWKLQYSGPEQLAECARNRSLPSSPASFPGLKDTNAHPISSMKVGDCLVLASLEGDQGKIVALGKVRAAATATGPAVVDWAATKKTVFPDAKGGLINWQTKSAFEISPEPAKKYGLKELVEYYVRDA